MRAVSRWLSKLLRVESRMSAEQIRHFADTLPIMAWTAHADGWINYYNRRWYDYTGTTPADMEGWGWQSVHDPAELPRVTELWRRCIATGEPFRAKFPIRGANGKYRWFDTRVDPVRGADGKVIGWTGCNMDIDHDHRGEIQSESLMRDMIRRLDAAERGCDATG